MDSIWTKQGSTQNLLEPIAEYYERKIAGDRSESDQEICEEEPREAGESGGSASEAPAADDDGDPDGGWNDQAFEEDTSKVAGSLRDAYIAPKDPPITIAKYLERIKT